MTMRSLIVALAAGAAVAVTVGDVAAAGPCPGPFCNQTGYPKYYSIGGYFLKGSHNTANKQPLPAYQAAPWYLYWPYDAHFMTPAPVTGAFYGPPVPGNFPVNPYFPGPAYGSYGPIPGGPPPRP
jgi:hypothetical protein